MWNTSHGPETHQPRSRHRCQCEKKRTSIQPQPEHSSIDRLTKTPPFPHRQVRTFKDFDESKLELKLFDGASLEPQHTPPSGAQVADLDDSTKGYRGSCHCGKVTFDLHSDKPLEDVDITLCNCSICSRVRLSLSLSSQNHKKRNPAQLIDS